MSETEQSAGPTGLSAFAASLMRVDAAWLFAVALLLMVVGSFFAYLPDFLGMGVTSGSYRLPPSNADPLVRVSAFAATLFGFLGYLFTNLTYPIAIFAAGRLVAEAIRVKSNTGSQVRTD